jgi:hypothetical protein
VRRALLVDACDIHHANRTGLRRPRRRGEAEAVEILEANRDVLLDRYDATAIELGMGFGRAWQGENGGDYMVVNVDDFGIVVTLRSIDDCLGGADLYRRAGGIPLFFFVSS